MAETPPTDHGNTSFVPCNPHFPAHRSGHRLFQRPSPQSKFLAVGQQLGVFNSDGKVCVRRNGQARTSDFALADGQIAVLSLVVKPDGTWKAFADNREIMASDSADQMKKLVPGVAGGFGRCINLGRNEPDGWSTFNGEIGDVFLYKTALSDAEHKELVNFVAAKLVGGGKSKTAE